jgi:parvulin-like peptidyl-prolyl isomerase
MRPRLLALLLVLAVHGLALAGTVKPGAVGVARVNGVPISAATFAAALQVALAQGATDSPEVRAVVRQRLIAMEVLRQEAAKHKLQTDPSVLEARDLAMVQRYLRDALKPAPVPEAAVRSRYDAIVAGLGSREYKLSLIAVADEATARNLIASLRKNEAGFEDLARKHSLLPSRAAGGALDWVSFPLPPQEGKTQGLPLPVANVAAALAPGALAAEPIAAEGRFHLVRLDASRPTRIPEYDDVKAALRRALEAQELERATAALMGRLIGAARIE